MSGGGTWRPRGLLAGVLIIAGWLTVAQFAGRPLVVAAHGGHLPGSLGRALQARLHRPLDHYLTLWAQQTVALALGLAAFFVLTLRNAAPGGGRPRSWFPWYAGAFLAVAVLSGPRHDYMAYLEIWEGIRGGGDPWAVHPRFGYSLNAYGPLFNLCAPLAGLSPLLPKILFVSVYLGMLRWLWPSAEGDRRSAWRRLMGLGLVSPYFWVEVALFGHFDIVVALACVSAARWVARGRDRSAGLALAVGVLLKYLPVVLLPVLAISERRVRVRFLVWAIASTAVGLALAALVWGPSVLRPIAFASNRGSTFASVFRFLRGSASPLTLLGVPRNLDRFSLPAWLMAELFVLALVLRFRLDLFVATTLAALTAVACYRVGFLQYHALVIVLLADVGRGWRQGPDHDHRLRFWAAAYLAWLSALELLVAAVGGVIHPGDRLAWLDEIVGLPSFVLELGLAIALVRAARSGGADGVSGPPDARPSDSADA